MPSILLVTALLTAQTPAVPVDISGPAAGAASCVIVAPSADTASGWSARPLTDGRWSCAKDELLQCNAEGFEPLDVPATACTAGRVSVRMRRGAPVRLTLQGRATLEWRAVGARGTQLLATRALPASSDVLIAEPRVLRVHRPGRAPISLVARPGAKLVIPAGVEGGELFGRVLGDVIRPERVHFTGPTVASVYVDPDGHYASPALLPGAYQVEAEYRGGIRSEAVSENVVAGRTTERFGVGTPDAGGVVVTIDPTFCRPDNHLELSRLEPIPHGVRASSKLRGVTTDLGCDVSLDGLIPGTHHLEILKKPLVPLFRMEATREFLVPRADRTVVTVTPGAIRLTGLLTAGTKPLAGVRIDAEESSSGFQMSGYRQTITDASGRYSFRLEHPGVVNLKLKTLDFVSVIGATVSVAEPETVFDWTLPDTSMTLTVLTEDGTRPTEALKLTVEPMFSTTSLMPYESNRLVFPGIDRGTYTVTASTPTMVSTGPITLTVGESTPHVEATVVLSPVSNPTVRVTALDGTPISNAWVFGGDRVMPLISAGLYSAKNVAPGLSLLVSAPGFVPYCRFIRRAELQEIPVTLTPGTHTARFLFRPTLEPGELPGYIFGLPGNECPVDVSRFSLISRRDADGATTFTIGDLPEGEFQFSPTAEMPPRPLHVPGPGLSFSRGPRPPQ